MTRRTLLILVTVLVTVFTFGPINGVSACELNASDQCEQMAATDHAAQFRLAITPAWVYQPTLETDAVVTAVGDVSTITP